MTSVKRRFRGVKLASDTSEVQLSTISLSRSDDTSSQPSSAVSVLAGEMQGSGVCGSVSTEDPTFFLTDASSSDIGLPATNLEIPATLPEEDGQELSPRSFYSIETGGSSPLVARKFAVPVFTDEQV
jgi:hypothetical protein